MVYYYVPVQSENIPNIPQLPMGYTEYQTTGNQQQPHHPVMYQQAASSSSLPTYPIIISHQLVQQASPPESPRSLCSSSDESHQKSNSAIPKKKRTRTAFNTFQVMELEREYRRSMYMQRHRRQEVAQRLSLDEKHIKIWFQNRRMRYKREGMLSQKEKPQERVQAESRANESSDHENIVQRFMSYAQDSLTQESSPASIELHQPQLPNLLPPSPPPTESAELTEILDLLAESSPATIPSPSSELSRGNFTEILDYLQETSTPTSDLVTTKESEEFADILEYLTESSSPNMPLKADSELSEILDYLVESSLTTNDMNLPAHFHPFDDDVSFNKIRNELELSAEAWSKRPTPATTAFIPEHLANSTYLNISKIDQ